MRLVFLAVAILSPGFLFAGQHSGSVRAADQFLPGATVTARQGGAKLVTYTDESGRYSMDLTPGVWEIEISMFGFTTARENITITAEPVHRDWTLAVPRFGAPAAVQAKADPVKTAPATSAATPPKTATPAAAATTPAATPATPAPAQAGRRGQGRGNSTQTAAAGRGGAGRGANGGRGGAQQAQPGFQNMSVTATEEGAVQLASAEPVAADLSGDASESFMVVGSQSGGLGAAADDQMRRDRFAGGRGGPGGGLGMGGDAAGGLMGLGGPGGDGLGLGGFGAGGANNGFGTDAVPTLGMGGPAGFGGGGGRGGGGGGGGGGRGGGGGGGGRGGGGGGGGRGGRGGPGGRGPFNGQYARFGNRRRQAQSPYTGTISATITNSALNAAPFSLNGQSQVKPATSSENISGTFGGPVRVKNLITGDKWSFSLSLQTGQNRGGGVSLGTLPTPLERTGDFSQSVVGGTAGTAGTPVVVYDPSNHQPFPGNVIPSNRFNPASLALMAYFPQPTYSQLTTQNYSITRLSPSSRYSVGARLQGSLTTKDRLSTNVQYQWSNSTSEQLFGYNDTTNGYGLSSTLGWTHSFKPRFNNSASLAFSRNISKAAPYFAYKENVAGNLGITGPDQSPIDYGPPSLSFTNFSGLSDGTASLNRSQTVNFTDSVTYVAQRKHNLNFGFGYRRMQTNTLSYANSRGGFSFSGLLTSGLDSKGQPVANTGYDFADFLLGFPQTSSLRVGNSNNYFRGSSLNWSVRDDWRVNSGLTLDLGLRYEYFSPYTELFGHLSNLDVNSNYTAVAQVTSGQTGPFSGKYPASLIDSDPNNYSPRIGFAWKPSQKHSRVIRGGYSIFFSGLAYNQIAARMAGQPPFAYNVSLSTNTAAPLTLQNGFSAPPSVTIANTYAVAKDYKPAYAQTWTIALQQTLPHNLVTELEYLGTKGTGLEILSAPNQAPLGTAVGAGQSSLRIPNAASFTYITDGANSIFNAGQVRLTKRMSRGMSAVALYTFSKSIDDASSFSGGGGGSPVQDPFDVRAERALSTSDQRHRLSLTYMLSSPVGVRGLWRNGGFKTKALTGWTFAGSFNANSGTPLTAYVSGNLSNVRGGATTGKPRAEATGLPIYADGYPYFNLNAFATPPDGEYGNAGRDTIPGVATFGINGSLNRAWRFGESRKTLQFRINTNNMLNHVQITGFGTTLNSKTYGVATSASGTRTVNLVVRFSF